jgi:putative transposase
MLRILQSPSTAERIAASIEFIRSFAAGTELLLVGSSREAVDDLVRGFAHPTSNWIVQQLREAFPYQSTPKFLILDHDAKYGLEVPAAIRSMKMRCVQTSVQSPWQNGVAERWVGSCRRKLLDQIIPLNERHLKRLLLEFISYYHDDRTHLDLHKQTPGSRAHSVGRGPVISRRRLGGLHHRYDRAA